MNKAYLIPLALMVSASAIAAPQKTPQHDNIRLTLNGQPINLPSSAQHYVSIQQTSDGKMTTVKLQYRDPKTGKLVTRPSAK